MSDVNTALLAALHVTPTPREVCQEVVALAAALRKARPELDWDVKHDGVSLAGGLPVIRATLGGLTLRLTLWPKAGYQRARLLVWTSPGNVTGGVVEFPDHATAGSDLLGAIDGALRCEEEK
jgi:hypothetical protein